MINLIFAMDKNHLIGNNDKIPWHYKEDLIYFKEHTQNQDVLMGDVTYLSLKGYYKTKPLPYKTNYVATLNKEYHFEDAIMIYDAISFLKNQTNDLWVIGGRSIYKLALPYADRLYITLIDKEYEGNVYFPEFDINDFKLISKRVSNELNFLVYERVNKK